MSTNESSTPEINLDEFLSMPGADDILTAPESAKTTVFSKPKDLDTSFLEAKATTEEKEKKENKQEESAPVDLEAAKKTIDEIVDLASDTDEPKQAGRPKVDKSGLVDTFSKLIDEGLLVPFDDDKPMEE